MEIALISSAFADDPSASNWPTNRTRNVEFYAFMKDHLADFAVSRLSQHDSSLTALRVLADCDDVSKMAEFVDAWCKSKGDLRVVAICSFLPEIMAPEYRETMWVAAQKALVTLVKLIRALRKLGHPAKVLEFVGGSAIDGAWSAKSDNQLLKDEPICMLNILGIEEGINRLLNRMVPVAEEAAGASISERVHLALEMEPGPLFTVGSFDSIVRFCNQLDSREDGPLYDVVGLNLDIPHWAFLDHTSADDVASQPTVLRRILHAHISDHSCGHFGDSVIGAVHSLRDFHPWINLLRDLEDGVYVGGHWRMPFSGVVSYELECFSEKQSLDNALGALESLVTEPPLPLAPSNKK